MTKREKRLDKIRSNPNQVRPAELFSVLKDDGWILKNVSGSHHTFEKAGKILTIPYRVPYLKVVYVKLVLDVIGGG